MKKNILLLLVLILGLTGCSAKNSAVKNSNATNNQAQTTPAKDNSSTSAAQYFNREVLTFESENIKGEKVNEEIFKKSKLTLVNLWGTFCPPCVEEIPQLQLLTQEYDPADLQVLGIALDVDLSKGTNVDAANKILSTNSVTYENIALNSTLDYISSKVQFVPVSFFVNSEGKIIGDLIAGSNDKDFFKNEANKLLSK